MRTAILVVLVLVLAGCSGQRGDEPTPTDGGEAPRMLEPLDALTWTGTGCGELALFVEVPVANVRPFVPSQFTLTEAQGQATVGVAFARCATATVLGNDTNNVVMSDVGVYIEDPDGGPAPAFYHLWQASNRAATYENMSRVGLRTQAAPNSNFLTFGLVQATLVESRIAAEDGEYYGEGTSVPGSAQVPPRSFRWWHASEENGTMYTDFVLAIQNLGAARGNITAEAGSDLAKIFGGTNVDGTGLYWTFELTVDSRRTPA